MAFSIAPALATAVELSGDACEEDIYSLLDTSEDTVLNNQTDRRACMLIWISRKFSRIHKDDMDGAVEMYNLSLDHPFGARMKQMMKTMPYIMNIFIDGLIGFYAARKHQEDEQEWFTIGEKAMKHYQKWIKLSKWNFSNKLYLLEAEYYFLKGNNSMALEKYKASITAARDHRFLHEEGLAYSKLGHYHVAQGRKIDGKQSFNQADVCYKRWGAHRLVSSIENV